MYCLAYPESGRHSTAVASAQLKASTPADLSLNPADLSLQLSIRIGVYFVKRLVPA
jgi:hypothetical protein